MAPMERILIESEIKSLLVRERYYRDTCQWEKLRACYHPNALNTQIEITWFQGNIDGFVSGSKGMATGGTGAVHTICPVEVHVHGNKALSESTGSIAIRFQHDGGLFDCVSYTRFISRLENVNGEWKLLTLDAIYERDFIMPVLPGTVAEFPFPAHSRDSYRCISWVLSQKGFSIKQDLPGTDDPASCVRLMEAGLEWLKM